MINPFFSNNETKHWFIETHYPDYQKFLKLFDYNYQYHIDYGMSKMNYKWQYEYPTNEVDPEQDYINFLKKSVQHFPIKNLKFAGCWWVDYAIGSYSVMHQHVKGKKFTAVMFLTNETSIDPNLPHAGHLYATPNTVGYKEWEPVAGNVVIMDGQIYHGTYPNLEERKVFVVDIEYE